MSSKKSAMKNGHTVKKSIQRFQKGANSPFKRPTKMDKTWAEAKAILRKS